MSIWGYIFTPFLLIMKIKCLANVGASGASLEAGKTYDVSNSDGDLLIRIGKAEKAIEQKPKKTKVKNANN
tara:strand:- start:944 stop:1156 length:213 start_codon:yes stop_codon:yes gene_type:complete